MEKLEIGDSQSFMKTFKDFCKGIGIKRLNDDLRFENGYFQTILDEYIGDSKNELDSFLLKKGYKLKSVYNTLQEFGDNEDKDEFIRKKILVGFFLDNTFPGKIIVVEPIKLLISRRADAILKDNNTELEENIEYEELLNNQHINL